VDIDTSDVKRAQQFAKREAGDRYLIGTQGPNTYDCSGFLSVLINVLAGKANPHQRLFGTGNMEHVLKTMGWKQGKGGPHDVTVGFSTAKELQLRYGHTVGTLGGLNVEARGGKKGGVKVGPGARSPFEKMFRHHRHLPVMAASTQRVIMKAKAYPGHDLKLHSQDHTNVKLVKEALRIGGAPLTATPGFGPKVQQHVKLFQAHRGMRATGVVDKATWNRLMGFLKPPALALARIGVVGKGYDLRALAKRFAKKYWKSEKKSDIDLMQRLLLQANKDLRDLAFSPGSKVPGGFPMKVPTMKP
jgi:Putative peptidoglycan binding domain